jgi:hypothetical protein
MGKIDTNDAQEGNLYGGGVMNEIAKELLEALKNLHAVCREEGFDNATTGRQILMKDADEAIAKAEAAMAEPQPDADWWIKWEGGECPVDGKTKVDVRFLNGDELYGCDTPWRAGDYDWAHENTTYDIITYRIAKEPQ